MSRRTKSQHIGEIAHSGVRKLIGASPFWVARDQSHDYGVDIESEYCARYGSSTILTGAIVKIQIKGLDSTYDGRKRISISADHLRYSAQFRVPFLLVAYFTQDESAHWLWLQEYTLHNNLSANTPTTKKLSIPIRCMRDLRGDLESLIPQIALGKTPTSIELSLADTLNGLNATSQTEAYEAILEISQRYGIGSFKVLFDSTVSDLKQRAAAGDRILDWRHASATLSYLCHRFGPEIPKESIVDMVSRGTGYSNAGVGGLQNLYDAWGDYARGLKLSGIFMKMKIPQLAWYCAFRESHPSWRSPAAFVSPEDPVFYFTLQIQGLKLGISREEADYISGKLPYRGDSIFLNCLIRIE